jgi:hypothetical protein
VSPTLTATIAMALASYLFGGAPALDFFSQSFDVGRQSEVIVTVRAACAPCAWGDAGQEAAALRVSVDGKYSQHLLLTRGEAPADYRLTLGALTQGRHTLTVDRDRELSASGAGPAAIERVEIKMLVRAMGDDWLAQSMAPILHARPNTVGKFTDVPILAWYEIVPTARGRQFRYSIIFTNEDGGTATDRLMATWGRTTDIEFVYGVEIDASGRVLAEEFQGPGHEVPAFKGSHEAVHPVLFVSTDNNMVSESGPPTPRYAPAPERIDLAGVSREVVMDRHPWSYAVTAEEMQREGKIVEGARAGSGKIPDVRRFAFVEACTDLENAAVAFSVRARDGGVERWYDSDRGVAEFRIVRTGCFRGAVPLPRTAGTPDAVRFRAFSPLPQKGKPPPPPGSVRLTRVNQMFTLADDYLPRASTFSWTGSLVLPLDGEWREIR